MNAYGRFEILLPLTFNDGRPVPREFLADAAAEIQSRFGGVSWESQAIEGIWRTGGIEYRDQLNRIFVDAEDSEENRQFFIDLRTVAVPATGHLAHSSSNRNFVKSSKLSSRCDYTARNAPMQL